MSTSPLTEQPKITVIDGLLTAGCLAALAVSALPVLGYEWVQRHRRADVATVAGRLPAPRLPLDRLPAYSVAAAAA